MPSGTYYCLGSIWSWKASCLLLCLHLCKMFHYHFVFHIKAWQTIWHFSGCGYCITTVDQDLSTTAGPDKLVLCGVGQMAKLFISSGNCVLKKQHESYCWQEEHQLLLDTVLFYDVLKGMVWQYVCVELRKESDDSAVFVQTVLLWVLTLQTEHLQMLPSHTYIDFFPHTTPVPALMTFLPGDVHHTESA